MSKNADMPAMPLDAKAEKAIYEGHGHDYSGLTKREYMAGLAMQAFISTTSLDNPLEAEALASYAVHAADTLLARLESEDEKG